LTNADLGTVSKKTAHIVTEHRISSSALVLVRVLLEGSKVYSEIAYDEDTGYKISAAHFDIGTKKLQWLQKFSYDGFGDVIRSDSFDAKGN
jgi:hypothetical protein